MFPWQGFKTSYSLFLIAEYNSSKSIGKVWFFLTHERKLSLDFLFSAIAFDHLAIVGAKFVFLDFLEFKAFQAGRKLYHISYLPKGYT